MPEISFNNSYPMTGLASHNLFFTRIKLPPLSSIHRGIWAFYVMQCAGHSESLYGPD